MNETHLPMANRPGLDALAYRVGTHSSFLETMMARLSTLARQLPAEDESREPQTLYPLRDLTTRQSNDPAIALLDGWAMVADVLTFYQERMANEGYLRTATERRSILELARLVGYKLRPGVAASTFLAFSLDNGYQVTIPAGSRAQSIPGPGELPQSFETAEPLPARAEWNELKPRLTRPQPMSQANATTIDRLYFKGIATNLKPNDPLLFVYGRGEAQQVLCRVASIATEAIENRTQVTLQHIAATVRAATRVEQTLANSHTSALANLAPYLPAAAKAPSQQPANRHHLPLTDSYTAESDIAPQLLAALRPELAPVLYRVWRELPLTPETAVQFLALRTRASVFGHNAPDETIAILVNLFCQSDGPWILRTEVQIGSESVETVRSLEAGDQFPINLANAKVIVTVAETDIAGDSLRRVVLQFAFDNFDFTVEIKTENLGEQDAIANVSSSKGKFTITAKRIDDPRQTAIQVRGQIPTYSTAPLNLERSTVVWLDTAYEKIVLDSWVILTRPFAHGEPGSDNHIPQTVIAQVTAVSEQSRADYGLPGMKSTRLTLSRPWLDPTTDNFAVIRGTAVYAQSEQLTLTEAPIDPVAEAICGHTIELGGLYDGLEAGRWLIISGERTDITPEKGETAVSIKGIPATELVMLAGVEQIFDATLPGETAHTRLRLANDLAYCYKRDTVTIYGNVAKATHGETRQEVLGSGQGSQPFQRFTLKQPPLTFVAAATASGVANSLVVRVNDVKWHEADSLSGLEPADRAFTIQTDNEENVTLIFGDGRYGSHLPTGSENIRAVYRNGIGKMGNVAAGQISMLLTRPLGVKGVVNPLPATGGTDRDSRDQARGNAPLAVMALDRLVSVQDYADFARTFAGIGKASAVRLADGRRQVVHLTIAGAHDIPIDKNCDLYRNLDHALHQFGDPYQPVQIDVYRRKLLIINGRIRVLPDFQWETVAPQLQATLRRAFSFERRELGQDVPLSEVISVIQSVRGVAYVDIDLLDGIDESLANDPHALINALLVLPNSNSTPDKQDEQPRNRIMAKLAQINPMATDLDGYIQPAELIYLNPDVPDTVIFTELPHG